MRQHCTKLIPGILALLCLAGCSQKQLTSEEIAPGYTAEIREIQPTVTEYRLYLAEKDERRLVTMAIVEDGRVQTLLPTVYGWGCTGARDSDYLATVSCGAIGDTTQVTVVALGASGRVAMGRSRSMCDIAAFGEGLCRMIDGVLVAEIEMQVDFASFQSFIKAATNAEKLSGLVLRPKLEHPTRELPPKPVEPTEMELEQQDGR